MPFNIGPCYTSDLPHQVIIQQNKQRVCVVFIYVYTQRPIKPHRRWCTASDGASVLHRFLTRLIDCTLPLDLHLTSLLAESFSSKARSLSDVPPSKHSPHIVLWLDENSLWGKSLFRLDIMPERRSIWWCVTLQADKNKCTKT